MALVRAEALLQHTQWALRPSACAAARYGSSTHRAEISSLTSGNSTDMPKVGEEVHPCSHLLSASMIAGNVLLVGAQQRNQAQDQHDTSRDTYDGKHEHSASSPSRPGTARACKVPGPKASERMSKRTLQESGGVLSGGSHHPPTHKPAETATRGGGRRSSATRPRMTMAATGATTMASTKHPPCRVRLPVPATLRWVPVCWNAKCPRTQIPIPL